MHELRRELSTFTRGVGLVQENSEQYEDSWKEGYGKQSEILGKMIEDSEEGAMYFRDFGQHSKSFRLNQKGDVGIEQKLYYILLLLSCTVVVLQTGL